MFATGKGVAEERHRLWLHSLGCATVARVLAEERRSVASDDAFLAGIFHDVGKLFLFDVDPQSYGSIAADENSVLVEREVYGVTHEEVGQKSAHSWGLAENIKVAIGSHHCPKDATTHEEFVMLISGANDLAKYWGIGTRSVQDEELVARIIEKTGLSPAGLDQLHERVTSQFANVTDMFGS